MVLGGVQMPLHLEREIARLYPGARVEFAAYDADATGAGDMAIDGLKAAAGKSPIEAMPIDQIIQGDFHEDAAMRRTISAANREIIQKTGKPTDGLVSQWINRPISQFISSILLRWPAVRPIHATIAAGLTGVVMAACLFLGGGAGLIAGAILFQIASIIDGVDGEIARATQRSSKCGATLDTATDALTNFAFIAGVSVNLLQSGQSEAGWAGLGGLALLFTGLTILGLLSLRAGGPLSFDALKHQAQAARSPLITFLAKITSRDVYALVLAVMIVIGLAGPAMVIFAAAIAVWFAAAMLMLLRKHLSG